jgi:hypothetical protein
MGFDRIAAVRNAEGVPTRGRGRWHGFAVNQILAAQGQTARRSPSSRS